VPDQRLHSELDLLLATAQGAERMPSVSPYEELLQRCILDPLELRRTSLRPDEPTFGSCGVSNRPGTP